MKRDGSLQLVSLAAKSKKYISPQKQSLNFCALVSQSIQRCSDAGNIKFRLGSPLQNYYHNPLQVLDHCLDVLIFISASHLRMNYFILSFKEIKYLSLNNPTSSFGHIKRRKGIVTANHSYEDLKVRKKIFKRSDSLAMRNLLCILGENVKNSSVLKIWGLWSTILSKIISSGIGIWIS